MSRGSQCIFVLGMSVSMLIACNSPKRGTTTSTEGMESSEEVSDHIIKHQLILQLKQGTEPRSLEEEFDEYDLKWIETIAPSMRLHLYRFDSESIPHDEVLNTFKASESVVEAEFNKRLSPRR